MSHADDTSHLVPSRGNLPAPRRSPLAERVASDLAAGRPRVGVGSRPKPLADRILEALDPLRDRMEVIDVSGWGNTALEFCHGRVDVLVCFHDVELTMLDEKHLPPLPYVFLDWGGGSAPWITERTIDPRREAPGFALPIGMHDMDMLAELPWLVELAVELGRRERPEPRPRRMLWAEDQASLRGVIEYMAPDALAPLEVQTAANGDEAFEMLDGRIDEFDLVVTDVYMPYTRDGLFLLERLRPQAAGVTPLALEWYGGAKASDLLQSLSTATRPHVQAIVEIADVPRRRPFERLFRIKDAMRAIRQRSP